MQQRDIASPLASVHSKRTNQTYQVSPQDNSLNQTKKPNFDGGLVQRRNAVMPRRSTVILPSAANDNSFGNLRISQTANGGNH